MSQIFVYDFTIKKSDITRQEIIIWLKEWCKKWVFQLEKSETGYEHWQGCFSLFKKKRMTELVKVKPCQGMHVSPMSNNSVNQEKFTYFTKADTRIEGPWDDRAEPLPVPRQIAHINQMYPWQQTLIDVSKVFDARSIHAVIDTVGNNGKTCFKTHMATTRQARVIPFANDYRDILRMVCGMETSNCYIIDMPRAISKDKLFQFWSAIETVKDGWAYDDRYHFKEKYFDSPQIIVFMNKAPDTTLLSTDRWKLHTIENHVLVPYQGSP